MAAPTVNDLGDFVGRAVSAEQAGAALRVATSQVRAYVRGVGFDADGSPNDELGAVVLCLAARYLAHPRIIGLDESERPASVSFRTSPGSFTVAELYTLNRYRQRAL